MFVQIALQHPDGYTELHAAPAVPRAGDIVVTSRGTFEVDAVSWGAKPTGMFPGRTPTEATLTATCVLVDLAD